MSRVNRVLRHEFHISISLGALLAIAVLATAITLTWPHFPSWLGFVLGVAVVLAERIWVRRSKTEMER